MLPEIRTDYCIYCTVSHWNAIRGIGLDALAAKLRTLNFSVSAGEIDDGLRKLEAEAPRAGRIVELHYFAGLSLPQVAEQLGISTRTVNREWRFARAFLNGDAAGDDPPDGAS